MTNEEIAEIMHLSLAELTELCKDSEEVARVISYAINMGINIGQDRVHKHYNQMFRSYNKVPGEIEYPIGGSSYSPLIKH